MNSAINLNRYYKKLNNSDSILSVGSVTNVTGLVVEAKGPVARIGTVCDIFTKGEQKKVGAEVLGFKNNKVLLMPFEEIRGIGPGSRVIARQEKSSVSVGKWLLGRVIDGIGNPIDNKGQIKKEKKYPIYADPVNPLSRKRITTSLDIGIRAVNGLLTIGCGQRMGIFSGSGVGKSVLLGMIARNTKADVNVIALIGERGREVNEFIEKELGEEGLKRSVISDFRPPSIDKNERCFYCHCNSRVFS